MKKTLKNLWLKSIKNGIDSKDFRNFYIRKGEKWIDVSENGLLSCAIFVSRKLSEFSSLISSPHTTIASTEKDMIKSGWYKIENLKSGAILIWEDKKTKTGLHKHIGIYIGNKRAISNRTTKKSPTIHHYTYGNTIDKKPKRNIIAIYWHNSLDDLIK